MATMDAVQGAAILAEYRAKTKERKALVASRKAGAAQVDSAVAALAPIDARLDELRLLLDDALIATET